MLLKLRHSPSLACNAESQRLRTCPYNKLCWPCCSVSVRLPMGEGHAIGFPEIGRSSGFIRTINKRLDSRSSRGQRQDREISFGAAAAAKRAEKGQSPALSRSQAFHLSNEFRDQSWNSSYQHTSPELGERSVKPTKSRHPSDRHRTAMRQTCTAFS